jgi:hypothetical protein
LQQFQVEVIDDVWPDHAILLGRFRRLKMCVSRDVWRMPSEFPWPKQWHVDPDFWQRSHDDLDARYAELWKHIEVSAATTVPFQVPKQSRGRAQTLSTTQAHTGKFAPVRVGMRGDFQPQFFGCSFRHAQWIRQIRRLQAFVRSFHHDLQVSQYGVQVWAAVVRAPGFVGGFANWWKTCTNKVLGLSGVMCVKKRIFLAWELNF